jgi:chlorite dismutase
MSENAPDEDLYTLWAVLRRDRTRVAGGGDLAPALAAVQDAGVTIRGFYDASSIRADSDLMVWLHGPAPEGLQRALRDLLRSEPLATLRPTWNVLGVHRPAFLRGAPPQRWLTVYPFVRSYDWYVLPAEERSAMLADHGRKGASHRSVLSNTVAAFGLGDYEWILALEAPELVDLVDLMRHLRETDARRHVREETPFYVGRRIEVGEIAEVLG